MKPVPMDPDKMTAGISFVNVGQNAIVSVELDFLDSSNISAVRDNPEKGIKIDMELGPGKTEDHLVLFNVSKLFLKGCSQFQIFQFLFRSRNPYQHLPFEAQQPTFSKMVAKTS